MSSFTFHNFFPKVAFQELVITSLSSVINFHFPNLFRYRFEEKFQEFRIPFFSCLKLYITVMKSIC